MDGKKILANEEIISYVWHDVIEDAMWDGEPRYEYGAGIINMNEGDGTVTIKEVKEAFDEHFKTNFGVNFGDKCPSCNIGKVKLCGGSYGEFLGCSNYPNCKHINQEITEKKESNHEG